LVFFPIFWMVLTGFKTEVAAVQTTLLFEPTLENYRVIFQRADYFRFAMNSVVVSVAATLLAMTLATGIAYAAAFLPTRGTRFTLLWVLSTKMLPPVGVLIPVYLIFRDLHIIDTRIGLTLVYALTNLPVAIWMLFAFFRDIPHPILEAARVDGANVGQEMSYILLPLSLPGIASTALLCIILCWNEAFWSLHLTTSDAAPLTAFIASFSAPEGLFWAKLSAASTMAVAPILLLGWLAQKQLVRGLTFGAVK
jgi:sorbitol/mannitol transport system permease protein